MTTEFELATRIIENPDIPEEDRNRARHLINRQCQIYSGLLVANDFIHAVATSIKVAWPY